MSAYWPGSSFSEIHCMYTRTCITDWRQADDVHYLCITDWRQARRVPTINKTPVINRTRDTSTAQAGA